MKTAPPRLSANLITGTIALVAVVALLLYFAIGLIFSGPVIEPRTFVAYFENSSDLREGDAVRIQGRRAGRVTDVTVVQHEGRAMARVEFVIAPGTGSPWLREMVDTGGIPADSSIRVRPAGMRGRPRLDITIGSRADIIEVGGEWKNTRSGSDRDQFGQWKEDLDRARGQIDELLAFFDDDRFDAITGQLAELRGTLQEVDGNLGSVTDNLPELLSGIDGALETIERANANLRPPADGDPATLQKFADELARADARMADMESQLTETADAIERMRKGTDIAAKAGEDAQLRRAGLELRKQAARLRASMARAVGDPSRFGNMPTSRFWRPYFHGGEPRGGTSIDDPPVPAPGEGTGVPKGVDGHSRK